MLLFGVTGTFFGLLLATAAEQITIQRDAESQYEAQRARQLGEHIRLIDIVSTYDKAVANSRMSIDIMSTGPTPINILYVLVDGVIDYNAAIQTAGPNATDAWQMPRGKVIRVNATEPGGLIILVTENDKAFRFGSKG